MARLHTPFKLRHTPRKARHNKSPKPALKLTGRSPAATRLRLQPSRFLKSRPHLQHIREGSVEDEPRSSHDLYRGYHDGDGEQQDSSEDELLDWDEETTLVAMLQDDTPEEDEREDLIALAQRLKAPMSEEGVALKQYLVQTLVPVTKRVKEVHTVMEEKTDLAFGAGLLAFDNVCKKVEEMAMTDEDELKAAHLAVQNKVKELFTQLKQAYARRDKLWVDFQTDWNESGAWLFDPSPIMVHADEFTFSRLAERSIAALEALPDDLEKTIARLDLKSKELEKDNGGTAKSKEKMLKDLLEKL